MCQGLAFLVRHLIVSYDGEKIKLRNLLQDVSPELAIDYDLLRPISECCHTLRSRCGTCTFVIYFAVQEALREFTT